MKQKKEVKKRPNNLPYRGPLSNVFGINFTPRAGLCADASTKQGNTDSEYQIYDLKQKKIIVNRNIGFATNNLTEYFGLIHAIKLCVEGASSAAYTDSMVALYWFNSNSPNTNFNFSTNPKIHDILQRAFDLKADWEIQKVNRTHFIVNGNIDVMFWNKKVWGEIPADFGRK